MVPANREQKINGIRCWEQAFRAYATIFCGVNPQRSKEIWQYIAVINTAAAAYSWENVYNYDITFRHLMAFNPNRSWAVTYNQMWNLSMRDPISKQTQNYSGKLSNNFSYQGQAGFQHYGQNGTSNGNPVKNKSDYCWSFNRGETCKFGNRCHFIERCSYCDSPNHPIIHCPKAKKKGINGQNSFKERNGNANSGGGKNGSEAANTSAQKLKKKNGYNILLVIYMVYYYSAHVYFFTVSASEVDEYVNLDLDKIVTPVDVVQFEQLLQQNNYNKKKTEYLVQGFTNGFDLGYAGDSDVKMKSQNLRLRVGSKLELWNKVMAEVKEGRFAGPFKEIPFENYIQSPIGLVPKDKGKKTRLIFHLSHPRGKNCSVNDCIPKEICSVRYPDFEDAVKLCMKAGVGCSIAKSDMSRAFRNVLMARKCWKFLVMKAKHPITKEYWYFIDKCMPFGSSISCAIFQEFSDAVSHIVS